MARKVVQERREAKETVERKVEGKAEKLAFGDRGHAMSRGECREPIFSGDPDRYHICHGEGLASSEKEAS